MTASPELRCIAHRGAENEASLFDYEAVGKSTSISFFFGYCIISFLPATEKMASGGPGGGNEPPVAGMDAAKSWQEAQSSKA